MSQENHIQNALYHAKELDQALDTTLVSLKKMDDLYGLVKSFSILFKICKSESKLIVQSLERELDNEFGFFYGKMIDEMNRHVASKGDSWRTMPLEKLEDLAVKAIWEVLTPENLCYETNPDQLIDIANYCAMLWLRLNQEADKNEISKHKLEKTSQTMSK